MYPGRCAAAVVLILTIFLTVVQAQDRATLKIATEGAYPPFNTVGPDGQLSGFDVDIAKALCAKMGAECELVVQDWDGLIPALQAGKFDAIVASMSITEERRKQVAFTRKYYATPLSLAARREVVIDLDDPSTLAGKRIGAQGGTIHAEYAADRFGKAGAQVFLYPSAEEAALDVTNGRMDAMISDKLQLMDWLSRSGSECCKMIGDIPQTDTEAAIAVRLDDVTLRDRFNAAIEAIRSDGTYDRIRSRYFAYDIY